MSKEAIALDSNRAEAYMWAGAGLGCVGLTRGILSSLQLIPQGKEYYGHNAEAVTVLEKIADNKPKNEFEHFMFETNKRKALEIMALIKAGTARDPFFDVVSDIQPGIFE